MCTNATCENQVSALSMWWFWFKQLTSVTCLQSKMKYIKWTCWFIADVVLQRESQSNTSMQRTLGLS